MLQYHPGETVQAPLNFVHGEGVRYVVATFAHADDPDTKFRLYGVPEEQVASEGAGYTYWRVILSGKVTTEDKPGEYWCEEVEAEYTGWRKVAFAGVPETGFEIAEEEIQPPEITGDWEWGSSQQG